MERIIFYALEFVMAFVLIFLFYKIVVIKDEKFKKNKLPVELNLFIKLYRPNLKKISHKKLMTNLSLIISFDVALILVITEISDKLVLKLCIGLLLVIILMRTSYDLYAKYLDKRGMIEHERL